MLGLTDGFWADYWAWWSRVAGPVEAERATWIWAWSPTTAAFAEAVRAAATTMADANARLMRLFEAIKED